MYVTRDRKTGLNYTKYTSSYYGMYLLFCMGYAKSVCFIDFVMDICIYDYILHTIWITDKNLLHFKLLKLGQILCALKTDFPSPGLTHTHTYICIYIYITHTKL